MLLYHTTLAKNNFFFIVIFFQRYTKTQSHSIEVSIFDENSLLFCLTNLYVEPGAQQFLSENDCGAMHDQ